MREREPKTLSQAAADPPVAGSREFDMREAGLPKDGSKLRRWASLATAVGMIALLSGCIIYPVGGGYGPPRHYWHDRY
jgi:hypothetical protein